MSAHSQEHPSHLRVKCSVNTVQKKKLDTKTTKLTQPSHQDINAFVCSIKHYFHNVACLKVAMNFNKLMRINTQL